MEVENEQLFSFRTQFNFDRFCPWIILDIDIDNGLVVYFHSIMPPERQQSGMLNASDKKERVSASSQNECIEGNVWCLIQLKPVFCVLK